MKLDISTEQFQKLSNEKKKKYIAGLIIRESGSVSVKEGNPPIAFVMAGLPGAGKTEFLDSLDLLIRNGNDFESFVRIDLDQIVSVYPDYTPKDYYKFRSSGNVVLARCVDEARKGRYNIMLDGTFSGKSGATINTIDKLLEDGYIVQLVYMYDNAQTAWDYTVKREKETNRGVSMEGFVSASKNLVVNLKEANKRYSEHPHFKLIAVVQKELRDKNYTIKTQKSDVDNIINTPYNIDSIKDSE